MVIQKAHACSSKNSTAHNVVNPVPEAPMTTVLQVVVLKPVFPWDKDGCTPNVRVPMVFIVVSIGILGDYNPQIHTIYRAFLGGFPIGVRWDRRTSNYPLSLDDDIQVRPYISSGARLFSNRILLSGKGYGQAAGLIFGSIPCDLTSGFFSNIDNGNHGFNKTFF